MAVLAGDIGGTKTLLQIAEVGRNSYRVIIERRYINQGYGDFTAVVNEFMQSAAARITRLPVATPPVNETALTPGWVVSAAPASAKPEITLSTPAGKPASWAISMAAWR